VWPVWPPADKEDNPHRATRASTPTSTTPQPQALDRPGAIRSFDPDGARVDLNEAIAQFRATGNDTSLAARLDSLGMLELGNGDLQAALVGSTSPLALAVSAGRAGWGGFGSGSTTGDGGGDLLSCRGAVRRQ